MLKDNKNEEQENWFLERSLSLGLEGRAGGQSVREGSTTVMVDRKVPVSKA